MDPVPNEVKMNAKQLFHRWVSNECKQGWHGACYETAIDCTCQCHAELQSPEVLLWGDLEALKAQTDGLYRDWPESAYITGPDGASMLVGLGRTRRGWAWSVYGTADRGRAKTREAAIEAAQRAVEA